MSIRKIKGKRRKEKGTFGRLGDPGKAKGEKEPERRRKKGTKERTNSRKTNILWRKGRRSCIPKGSHTQIISEGEVRSLTSVYNK